MALVPKPRTDEQKAVYKGTLNAGYIGIIS